MHEATLPTAPIARLHPSTLAVIAGRAEEPGDPLAPAPAFASSFRAGGERSYGRDANPTWEAFEGAVGALEGGDAVAFASGIAAATAVLDQLARGARVVAARSAYVEVRRLLAEREADGLIHVEYVDPTDAEAITRAAVGADLVWLDALANPSLDVSPLDLIAPAVRAAGASLLVDGTLATPILMRPLMLGADLVLHSATKYIGGHSDLVLGVVVARDPRHAERMREARTAHGAVPGTIEAWLGLRGLRTLALRVERGTDSAAVLAARLAGHPAVQRVRYPGLAEDPSHAVARRLLDGFGAVVSFELESADAAEAVCERVELLAHASSLGGVETVIERQGRWHAGPDVPGGLLRLSVGLEHVEDLWRDLDRALVA